MKSKTIAAFCVALGLFSAEASAETLSGTIYALQTEWLEQKYSDKTWKWENGHAYFAPDGTFQAAVGRKQSATGKWYGVKGGKICFKAEWTSDAGSGPAKKCWKHVADEDKQIWQAPLEGSFVLKWAPFDPETQLVPGNIYKSRFEYASGARKGIPAKTMAPREVARIYAGKTWKWEDGHAYFGSGGELTALSGRNAIGEGAWSAKGQGHLCINATWKSPDYGDVRKERCWLHAKDETGVIWQTPVDDVRQWSRFAPEEYLINGNPYASRFNRQKRSLSQ